MSRQQMKERAARAAVELVEAGMVVGVGTGSTANCFIDALAESGRELAGAVASSQATAERLRDRGIALCDLNHVLELPLYVDGADETDGRRRLIKGGGGALTREKIVASASRTFVCIVDESKLVERLGAFPLPVEVIPLGWAVVQRQLARLGGDPVLREGFVTDNANVILDVHGMQIDDPVALEQAINQIPGVVTNGLFALRPADIVILGGESGVRRLS